MFTDVTNHFDMFAMHISLLGDKVFVVRISENVSKTIDIIVSVP